MSITLNGCAEMENWSADDLNALTRRVEFAKEQFGCSLASVMEVVEILEQLQNLIPHSPENQRQYFRETADDLLTLAISWLQVPAVKTVDLFVGG